MRSLVAFVMMGIALAGCQRPHGDVPAGLMGQAVGNGSDFAEDLFEQGRLDAMQLLRGLNLNDYSLLPAANLSQTELKWVIDHADEMIDDLRSSPVSWSKSPPSFCPPRACSCTAAKKGSRVYFSHDNCEPIDQIAQAGEKWLHEIIHHFRGPDEATAKRYSVGLYQILAALNRLQSHEWTAMTQPMRIIGNPPRNHGVWSGSRFVIWGGDSDEVTAYDPATNTWDDGVTGNSLSEFTSLDEEFKQADFHLGLLESPGVWASGGIAVFNICHEHTQKNGAGAFFNSKDLFWHPITAKNAPTGRLHFVPISTGDRMVVWGGFRCDNSEPHLPRDGGIYDPKTDSWQPIPATGAPSGRLGQMMAWNGKELFVWGGSLDQSGGIYNPASGRWRPINPTGAPSARMAQTTVWTGNRLLVYGGYQSLKDAEDRNALVVGQGAPLYDGSLYDPSSRKWTPINMESGPNEPCYIDYDGWTTGVWTGTYLFCRGRKRFYFYSPDQDHWRSFPVDFNPLSAWNSTFWIGSELLFWGNEQGFLFSL